MHGQRVIKASPDGRSETILEISDDQPSGLGWLPDGRLLIVSMSRRQLLSWDGKTTALHADLSDLASWHCNDMVVDLHGNAYVGNFGFDLHSGKSPEPAEIIRVDPNGQSKVVATNVFFPNGMVITPDHKTMIVAETFGRCLSAFDIKNNGDLGPKRTWAEVPEGAVPDGICLDTAGGIWSASPTTNECLRQIEGGEVTHRIKTDRGAFACMIGQHKLYVLTSTSSVPSECLQNRDARVEVYDAPFDGAGLP
jgi:sugar lactone lactonase YvrE